MCGIFAHILLTRASSPSSSSAASASASARTQALFCSHVLRHRGPDHSGIFSCEDALLCHERLSIVDPSGGAQPLITKSTILCVNGEIYNHAELRADHVKSDAVFLTQSDCEVISHLYRQKCDPVQLLSLLKGMFAFVLVDLETRMVLVARDHMGIIPLYYGYTKQGSWMFASELKALKARDACASVFTFPPGMFAHFSLDTMDSEITLQRWYTPQWLLAPLTEQKTMAPVSLSELRQRFTDAVSRHLMSDVPYGVLLSGGLDSSLVCAIASKVVAASSASAKPLQSFCIGLEGSPDLKAAQEVADLIGTQHHSMVYTVQQGLDALSDAIYHLETYDVTTVRASTPMYLMARKIAALGIKMVLSGEGSDELFAGYLYFHKAPNRQELFDETVRKVSGLHKFDCLRANKSTGAWGLEVRVPFLDADFVDYAMAIDPADKMVTSAQPIEKFILRKAFDDDKDDPLLPASVLWRTKEQFSDGVGIGWIDELQVHAATLVSDDMLRFASHRFPVNTPLTKEAYLYRQLFEEHFPTDDAVRTVPFEASIACSTAKALEWDASFAACADPSGRAVRGVHPDHYKK